MRKKNILKYHELYFRISPKNLLRLKQQIKAAGLNPETHTSSYIRTIFLGDRTIPLLTPENINTLQFIYSNTARIGGLLNQINRILNSTTVSYTNAVHHKDLNVPVEIAERVESLERRMCSIKHDLAKLSKQYIK